MTYLRTKGYNARYLTEGQIGLAENLRGDNARDFLENTRSGIKGSALKASGQTLKSVRFSL